eukprot:CAMPEP_0198555352 /NCGR_PEP_ID=MMETSP1462-20131121/84571_1 /TAXON_ID=1333877 /ORGANISM="Brandtodinium nutriculum, Strain RCC3387" /LENGTH=57 /DNA_ID=CAMNT_0044286077 /DNA_START=142 /DNA_END=312 /DNA_ORIENTATION=-
MSRCFAGPTAGSCRVPSRLLDAVKELKSIGGTRALGEGAVTARSKPLISETLGPPKS